jgi:hypothetical protein
MMTEASRSRLSTHSRHRQLLFGIIAALNLVNALFGLFHKKEIDAAQHFLAACMWTFLAVERPEGRPRLRWLLWVFLVLFVILVLIDAGILDGFGRGRPTQAIERTDTARRAVPRRSPPSALAARVI